MNQSPLRQTKPRRKPIPASRTSAQVIEAVEAHPELADEHEVRFLVTLLRAYERTIQAQKGVIAELGRKLAGKGPP